MRNRIIIKSSLLSNPKFLAFTKEQIITCMNIVSMFAESNTDKLNSKFIELTFGINLNDYEGVFFIRDNELYIGNDFSFFKNNSENTKRSRAKRKVFKGFTTDVMHSPIIKPLEIVEEPIIIVEQITQAVEIVEEDKTVKVKDDIDYVKICEYYNNNCKGVMTKVKGELNPLRKTRLKSCYKDNKSSIEVTIDDITRDPDIYEFYEAYFEILPTLHIFVNGTGTTWKPDFDFSLTTKTFTKVKEGTYKAI